MAFVDDDVVELEGLDELKVRTHVDHSVTDNDGHLVVAQEVEACNHNRVRWCAIDDLVQTLRTPTLEHRVVDRDHVPVATSERLHVVTPVTYQTIRAQNQRAHFLANALHVFDDTRHVTEADGGFTTTRADVEYSELRRLRLTQITVSVQLVREHREIFVGAGEVDVFHVDAVVTLNRLDRFFRFGLELLVVLRILAEQNGDRLDDVQDHRTVRASHRLVDQLLWHVDQIAVGVVRCLVLTLAAGQLTHRQAVDAVQNLLEHIAADEVEQASKVVRR
ncbi:hypothetical protein D3C85_602750 [compost metagenome]